VGAEADDAQERVLGAAVWVLVRSSCDWCYSGKRQGRRGPRPPQARKLRISSRSRFCGGSRAKGSARRLATVGALQLEDAIRTRRTHKVYGSEPVDRAVLEELLELARWAPNHHMTEPWRFRVIGPDSLARLQEVAEPEAAGKLERAPTLVVASVVQTGDPVQDEEDLCAAASAAYIVLLAAHGRGLASYWRTPEVLRTPEGQAAVSVPEEERVLGLLHLGAPRQEQQPPERAGLSTYTTFLS